MCDQQRLRPACANAQSDQSLCKLLDYSMSVKLLVNNIWSFHALKESAKARLSLQLSTCHTVGNHVSRLISNYRQGPKYIPNGQKSHNFVQFKGTSMYFQVCKKLYCATVEPTESDSDVICCLQLQSESLPCILHLSLRELIDHLCINPNAQVIYRL